MPLLGGGGVFLSIVGAAITIGALCFRNRYQILAFGALAGGVAATLLAMPLSEGYGAPSSVQLWSLAVAGAFEGLALGFIAPRAGRRGERTLTAAILASVGAHLLIMTPAFGPLIFVLGIAGLINATAGVTVERYALPLVWAVDGGLKMLAGVAMLTVI